LLQRDRMHRANKRDELIRKRNREAYMHRQYFSQTPCPLAIASLFVMALNTQAVADGINSTTARNEIVLPRPEAEFTGKIGRTAAASIPDFPELMTAPAHAPNVLLIMTDDVGFGASGTFGGLIPTPTFSRLASNGLR